MWARWSSSLENPPSRKKTDIIQIHNAKQTSTIISEGGKCFDDKTRVKYKQLSRGKGRGYWTFELKPEGERGCWWGRAGHAGVLAIPKAWGEQVWHYRERLVWYGRARDPRGQPHLIEGGHYSNPLWKVTGRGVTKFDLKSLKDHFGFLGEWTLREQEQKRETN